METDSADNFKWPKIAVVGAGAVGGYFGGMLALAGAQVVLIGRKPLVDAVNRDGLLIESVDGEHRVRVSASEAILAAKDADLILFSVKSSDTEEAACELVRVLKPGAIVVSLQNGVDNVEKLQAAGVDTIPAAVYVAVSVPAPGRIKHRARGDLILGPDSERVHTISQTFERAGIPCVISDNVEGALWVKLLCNCALNAISALGHVDYGRIAESIEGRQVMQSVVDELLAVAKGLDVTMPGVADSESGMAAAMNLAVQMKGVMSSTAQDLERGKRTEIDALNGFVVRKGRELGVPTPVNQALHTLVKLAEGR